MMKNSTKNTRTLVCIGGQSKLNLYKIIEYKIKTIDKISAMQIIFIYSFFVFGGIK